MWKAQTRTDVAHAAPLFAALGDEVRLKLVARLSTGGPLSITRLSQGTNVTRQAVTKHLHVLATAGLAKAQRQGREQFWELKPEALEEARRCLNVIAAQWDGALQRLKAFAEGQGE